MLARSSRCTVGDRLAAEVAAEDVAPQRQRQAGLVEPPLAQVDDQHELLPGVGELAFVDDQAGVDGLALEVAGRDRVEDLVEGHDDVGKSAAQAKPQGQVGRGQRARHGDRRRGQVLQRPAAGGRPPSGRSGRPCSPRRGRARSGRSGGRRRAG